MISQTTFHYKILEQLGEVPRLPFKVHGGGQANSPTSDCHRVVATLSIPPFFPQRPKYRMSGIGRSCPEGMI